MKTSCATRAEKVLKHLQRTVPKTIPHSSRHALEELPSSVLARLHITSDWAMVTEDPWLKDWLANNPIPSPKATVSNPLFNGTLVFIQLIFKQPNTPPSSVSLADVQTALSYATLAAVPIQRYASQYGPNSISVWPEVIPFTANLKSDSFNKDQFEGWVEQCAQFVRAQDVNNPCIVILHNRDLANSPSFAKHRNPFHDMTSDGTPYCYCLVFGENLVVADNNHTINGVSTEKVYAHNLSHEIAEMVVDPNPDLGNPEVCDACSENCNNVQFDLFDQNGVFMGGTDDTASATGFAFFINSIVSADVALDSNACIVGSDGQSACIYPPPIAWSAPGTLTTVPGLVSIAGHFSSGDQRHLVVVGTKTGKVHEIYWQPAQVGIEGEDDLPGVAFIPGTIASLGSMYNVDQNRHVVMVATNLGKVHEIFWKPQTVGIEGQDDLPVSFPFASLVAVAGLYDSTQQRYITIVGTRAGKVHEIYWKDTTVGIEGQDDLPVTFSPGSIVAVTAIYNSDAERYLVVVGTNAGKLHEIFWQATTVGVEGHDDLPVDFGSGSIVAVSGLYDRYRQRYVIAVATRDGTVYQVYWHEWTAGIEAHSVVARFDAGTIAGLAAFYSESDHVNHIVVALSSGEVCELWSLPDV